MPIYFNGGSSADHQRMAAAIEKFWTSTSFGSGYSVTMRVLIQSAPNTASNYVDVKPGANGSGVLGVGGNYGFFAQTPYNSDNRDYAHEAGHFMGVSHNSTSASLMQKWANDTSPRVRDIEMALKSSSNLQGCGCQQ